MAPGERILGSGWRDAPDTQPLAHPAPAGTVPALLANTSTHSRFEAILARYETGVYDYIRGLVGNAGDANALTQDTFLRIYVALSTSRHDSPIDTWVFRIATSTCLDALRPRQHLTRRACTAFASLFRPRRPALGGPDQAPQWAGTDTSTSEGAPRLLAELPADERACLLLRERHQFSYDEIAAVLTTTRVSVQSLLFHAREVRQRRYPQLASRPSQLHA
jgi:RNA polymerase sigma-70 factor, ECF subfamily